MAKTVSFLETAHIIKEKPCVIEFQSFVGNDNEYIVKELVILDMETGVPYFFLLKPPFAFNMLHKKAKTTNRWLTRYYHNITWDEGFTSYKTIENIMYTFGEKFQRFYTTGLEKRNWIQMYTTGKVYNVLVNKEYNVNFDGLCIGIQDTEHSASHCALQKAYRLFTFLQKDQESGSGGGSAGYKYGSSGQTMHEYYSNLREGNTYSSNNSTEDGFTTVSEYVG